MSVRIAVLDDYQQVAAGCADWERIPRETYGVFYPAMVDAIVAFLEGEPVGVIR